MHAPFEADEGPSRELFDSDRCIHNGHDLLDATVALLRSGRPVRAMDDLVLGMERLRRTSSPEAWNEFIDTTCRNHPIADYLHQDPCTRLSADRPYGRSGDTAFLRHIHRPDDIPPGLSVLGEILFRYTTNTPTARSLRVRAAMIARTIDMAARRTPPRVLAIMSGHLWEAERSATVRTGGVEKLLAFDQDADNLAVIRESNYGPGVITYQGTLRPLMKGISVFRNFDLVYSHLCDTLGDRDAARLAVGLFRALAPGGTLLLSNISPRIVEIGYVEAFMNWHIVYRDENDLAKLSENIPPESIATARTFRDPYDNIVFLAVTRAT
jgi:hypothetical protein